MNWFSLKCLTFIFLIFSFSASAQQTQNATPLASSLSPNHYSGLPKSVLHQPKMEIISPWEAKLTFGLALGEGAVTPTLGFSHLYGFGESKKFKLGYGIRLSSFFGADQKYTAAPPDLAAEDDPQYILFDENNSQSNALNLGVYTSYDISSKISLGFNIDVIGFSFGAERDVRLIDERSFLPLISDTATPTSFNLLLVGDNDIGTLNSEFWLGYKINDNIALRGGFSYLFVEYTTEGEYQDDNDRFRYKAPQGFVALSYIF